MRGTLNTRFLTVAVLVCSLSTVSAVCTGKATYRVTFTGVWTSTSHPRQYPGGAHWSGLIGGSHNSKYTMWEPGGQSTAGMKSMAEFGGKSTLQNEMNAQGSNVLDILSLSGVGATGTSSGNLDVDGSHSLVSLVTMIAPSPDWFAGVHGLDLCNQTTWIQSTTVDLFPYDAGTDSGLQFGSLNSVTNPREAIHRLTGTNPNNVQSSFYGYATVPPMATLGFVRTSLTTPTPQTTTEPATTNTNARMTQAATTEAATTNTNTAMTQAAATTTIAQGTAGTRTASGRTRGVDQTSSPRGRGSAAPSRGCTGRATYQVTYETIWTEDRFPNDFPSNPHFSGLVGGSHNSEYVMWEPSKTSTRGMEAMAESGKQLVLLIEMEEQGDNMLQYLAVGGIGSGTGKRSRSLSVDNAHRFISLVSMIAPSPDWFVGVRGLDMCDPSAGWKEFVRNDLFPYDAGTDSGLKFKSPDSDTQPREGIHRLTNTVPNNTASSFFGATEIPHIATLRFNLTSVGDSGVVHKAAATLTCLTAVLVTATIILF